MRPLTLLFPQPSRANDESPLQLQWSSWDRSGNTSLDAAHLDCSPDLKLSTSTVLVIRQAGRSELLFAGTRLQLFARWSDDSSVYMDGMPIEVQLSNQPCLPTVSRGLSPGIIHNLTIMNNARAVDSTVSIFAAMIEASLAEGAIIFGDKQQYRDQSFARRNLLDSSTRYAKNRISQRSALAGSLAGGILGTGLGLMFLAFVVYIVIRLRRKNPPERVMRFDYEHARVRSEVEFRRQALELRHQSTEREEALPPVQPSL